MKILLMLRYGSLGASSRVRYLQYLPYFQRKGWEVEVSPLFSNAYIDALYAGQSRWWSALKGYACRLQAISRARRFDVLIIEKELFPFLPALFERMLARFGVPYVVDYDDAIFHLYDCHSSGWVRRLLGRKIDAVMRNAAIVVSGNEYLAQRARNAGALQVEVIPTAVDTDRYQPRRGSVNKIPVVGWIGTPETSRYLTPLLPVFEALQKKVAVRFVAIGARAEDFCGTPVKTQTWTEDTEVSSIQSFDIGIMPLSDTPWERGKCGYKLIQYMACGVPVVASPVGVNKEIIHQGINGFLAKNCAEWELYLAELLENRQRRLAMGQAGRMRVVSWYSVQKQAPRLIGAIEKAINTS